MTTGLCSKTCSKGPLHWLWFYLPSLTLVALSVFLYCVWMFLFIMPIVRKQGMTSSNQMLPIIVIFHVFFGLYVLCLFRTWATDAGRISERFKNKEFQFGDEGEFKMTPAMKAILNRVKDITLTADKMSPDMRVAIKALPVAERKGNGDPRHCWKCQAFKPDRTHHCSVCQECTLKMDHHCLWVGNCIGFFNHKFFLQFLFYGVLSALFVCIAMFNRMVHAFRPVWDVDSFLSVDCPIVVAYIMCLMVTVVIGIFFGFHMHLVFKGTTTIERREKLESDDSLVLHRAQIANIKFQHGGSWGNFLHVFGKNPLWWFLPISSIPSEEDGTYVDYSVYTNPPPELAKWDPYVHYFTAAPAEPQGEKAAVRASSNVFAGSPSLAPPVGAPMTGIMSRASAMQNGDIAVPVMSHSRSNSSLGNGQF